MTAKGIGLETTGSSELLTRHRNLPVKKVNDFEFVLQKDHARGIEIPVRIFADDALISLMAFDRTIEQAANVTTLPGVVGHVAVLPDGHEGYGFPVGGVAAVDLNSRQKEKKFTGGVISPGGVGYDINCGVRLIRTSLMEKDIKTKIPELISALFEAIPSGLGSRGQIRLSESELNLILVEGMQWTVRNGYGWPDKDLDACEENGCVEGADTSKVSDIAKRRGTPQLGSLGSGNHFLEIQKVEKVLNEEAATAMGILGEGQITVLIHCGSRGFGHQVCSDYLRVSEMALRKYDIQIPDRELACVPYYSTEGVDYVKGMKCALNFAWANRQLITHWTRKTFEKILKLGEEDLDMQLVYDVAHNIVKIEQHKIKEFYDKSPSLSNKNLIVHRKGATRAFPEGSEDIPTKYRRIGQPVIIPGSMGTASWLLVGGHNSMDLTFGSTAHGAGRTMSRAAARRKYSSYEMVKNELESKGIYIKSLTRQGILEEVPAAYKDVDVIANISHKLGIATKVARLVPLGVIKG
ncbi:MAG: RtcB family protein [Nitrososphaeraceae archaeon]